MRFLAFTTTLLLATGAAFFTLRGGLAARAQVQIGNPKAGGPIQKLPPAPENGKPLLSAPKPLSPPKLSPTPKLLSKPQNNGPTLRVGISTAGEDLEIYAPLGATLRDAPSGRVFSIAPGQIFRVSSGPESEVKDGAQTFRGPLFLQRDGQISRGWSHIKIDSPPPTRDSDEVRLRATSDGKSARWGRPYRGDLEVFPNRLPEPDKRKGPLALVNIVPLEEYLKGVVPYEMSPSAPTEALKAQAIGARTTALKFLNSSRFKPGGFDVCDYDACQAYPGTENEKPTTTRAVEATRGLVLRFKGALIDSVFGTNSGGITASAGDVWKSSSPAPYLVSSRDFAPDSELAQILKPQMSEGDWALYFSRAWDSFAKPSEADREALQKRRERSAFAARLFGPDDWPEFYRWKRVMSAEEVNAAFAKNGFASVSSFTVLERAPSGRIRRLEVRGLAASSMANSPAPEVFNGETASAPTPKTLVLEGDAKIRAMFSGRLGSTTALPSSSFVVAPQLVEGAPVAWVLQGAGWGHGVGMCQRGAQNRARAGASAREILAFYYRGATVGPL